MNENDKPIVTERLIGLIVDPWERETELVDPIRGVNVTIGLTIMMLADVYLFTHPNVIQPSDLWAFNAINLFLVMLTSSLASLGMHYLLHGFWRALSWHANLVYATSAICCTVVSCLNWPRILLGITVFLLRLALAEWKFRQVYGNYDYKMTTLPSYLKE